MILQRIYDLPDKTITEDWFLVKSSIYFDSSRQLRAKRSVRSFDENMKILLFLKQRQYIAAVLSTKMADPELNNGKCLHTVNNCTGKTQQQRGRMTDTGLLEQMQATAATIEDLSTGGAPSGKRTWVVVVVVVAAAAAAADSKSCLCTCGVAVAAAAASLVDWHV